MTFASKACDDQPAPPPTRAKASGSSVTSTCRSPSGIAAPRCRSAESPGDDVLPGGGVLPGVGALLGGGGSLGVGAEGAVLAEGALFGDAGSAVVVGVSGRGSVAAAPSTVDVRSARRWTVSAPCPERRVAARCGRRQSRHGSGEDDVQPAQAGALVRFRGGDGRGLDHDHAVVLQALRERRRHEVQAGRGSRGASSGASPSSGAATAARARSGSRARRARGISASATITPTVPSCAERFARRPHHVRPEPRRRRPGGTSGCPGSSRTERGAPQAGRDRAAAAGRRSR